MVMVEKVEMNTLKAWSDDEDDSSYEVLDEVEDVDDVVGEGGVLPGDGDVAQGHWPRLAVLCTVVHWGLPRLKVKFSGDMVL